MEYYYGNVCHAYSSQNPRCRLWNNLFCPACVPFANASFASHKRPFHRKRSPSPVAYGGGFG